ncbi:MAG TPA: double-strand break repair protein AddB [Acidocella sp.]|jgi:ATP-dependent helicase/nuclease subunit B|uniref:double-strand break repair protein AddB n=1 Tax=Acidocella sp. TaxID=50710 RepID=UPI002D0F028B|nr:double-strand break repair protein AddB [Acidocella sp.]HVE23732.1 double-strand break repair protein AddB [Acidocella sp.]
MKIGAFPAEAPFLPALAKLWLAAPQAPHEGLIILPSRRAAQALAGAFLAENGGKALLLPRIIALGAIEEAALALRGGLDLPPAIAPMRRQALLAQLILKMDGARGAPVRLPGAWTLAAELGRLLDEADYAGIDLAETLPGVVEGDLASHWQTTLEFLRIVTHHWPAILAARGQVNPAARLVGLIDAQSAAWADTPPAHRVWLVARDGNPALCRLARIVAGLDQGLLLLPGYDAELPDAAWETLDEGHAQAGIQALLAAIGAGRGDVSRLPGPAAKANAGRAALLSRALLPAAQLGEWQHQVPLDIMGISRLEAQDEAQDATAIAMILRDALEVPGRTAALITPDRGLATRVAAALKRFGVTADDSAGEKLLDTPPALLLRLLARAAAADYAPLPLLALLKHPLTAVGLAPEQCRDHAKILEISALRGPRPAPGFAGLRARLAPAGRDADLAFLQRLEQRCAPLALPGAANPTEALTALIQVAEAFAETADRPGAARLWSGEAGTALSDLLRDALASLADLPDICLADLPELLDALCAGSVVRRPRTKDGHPRVAIWGVQEASLQSVDIAVLGGLAEGVWPAMAEPGPWLSRPMRKAAGLPAPEAAIAAAAHDFFSLAVACGTVVLSAPARRERAPAVPARWLTRLNALLEGAGMALPVHDAASWAAQLDAPSERIARRRPEPRPPAAARPTILSISDVTTLLADPYAIYARRILKIRELAALDEESDQSQFGDIVHAGLAAFFADPAHITAPDAARRLARALLEAMRRTSPRAALDSWWAARLERIAGWIVEAERARRAALGAPLSIALEKSADMSVMGGFTLKGRVDRIERRADGQIAIMDYKTGVPPSANDLAAGTAPQLPLEAMMAEAGAFGPDLVGAVAELVYWRLSGRHEPGAEISLFSAKPDQLREMIDTARSMLPALFAKFADPATPYLAAPHPARQNPYDVYAGISRRAEWANDDSD